MPMCGIHNSTLVVRGQRIDLLASSCGSRLCNPRDQATHDAGAALDHVFISSPCEAVVRVHNGVSCSKLLPAPGF